MNNGAGEPLSMGHSRNHQHYPERVHIHMPLFTHVVIRAVVSEARGEGGYCRQLLHCLKGQFEDTEADQLSEKFWQTSVRDTEHIRGALAGNHVSAANSLT